MRSVTIFLNVQRIAPIKIHRQLGQVYGHTRLDGQHISCRSSAGRCLIIIHPISRISRPATSIFSYISSNSCLVSVCRMTERRRWVSQWFQSQAADFYDTEYKSWSHGMTNVSSTAVVQAVEMRACHAAGPGSIPGRDKFPGWGFFSPVRQMSGSFRPPRSPNIIWPSLSSSFIIFNFGFLYFLLINSFAILIILLIYKTPRMFIT